MGYKIEHFRTSQVKSHEVKQYIHYHFLGTNLQEGLALP